jgi:predicted ATPase/signal transduction histidine kinase/tRNA A-37 threonylcarbamoyl transferase component Bud32
MFNLPGYTFVETLNEGLDSFVYRAIKQVDKTSVIIKALKAEYPSLKELSRIKHEYKILNSLIDVKEVINPLGLKKYQNRLALVIEDFSAISLNNFNNTYKLSLKDFLLIATQLVSALANIHNKQVIHKDIKPQNIIINPKELTIKLIDFSIASHLSRENPTVSNPNLIEGTLAYMSPEQTGRMNRSLDYRTDFYSLGATFYQMLTGLLPFDSNDPLEIIHSHIAKIPASPHEINSEIPPAVSHIVMKLLAKMAEDRYQSALGLKADLELCLQQLENNNQIDEFTIGQLDLFSHFIIPQKLYGRGREVNKLLNAFERISKGQTELILVSGYSGIGKSSLVNEIHKPIVRQRGYFISGKFDQFKRNIPYASLIQAFQELMRQLLTESAESLKNWKSKLLAALDQNGQIVIDVIPEVERIIGSQPAVLELGAAESQNRFNRVFQQFIHVFTKREHPLVLFLDDLQWADSASLKLIELIVTEQESEYLLLIGAYRDNEVSATHPLAQTLEQIQKIKSNINNIVLRALDIACVNQLIADSLRSSILTVKPLAELVFNKTQGNPFFLTQLLKYIYDEKFLIFNFERGVWQWDIQQLQEIDNTDNVVELMVSQIQKLSQETINVLKIAACIGDKFTLDVLATVNETTESKTATDLWSALQAGLVLPLSNAYKLPLVFDKQEINEENDQAEIITYKFLHDRVQQAAYSLIPDEQKKATHLRIGQLLVQNATPEERKENIFALVNQLNYGTELLTSQSEKYELAQLNLIAGQKAKAATAHDSAVKYLQVGLGLLAEESWKCEYELTLALHSEAAEAAFLSGDFAGMHRFVEIVKNHAKTLLDKIKVYEVQIQAYMGQNRLLEAVNIGLQVLKLLGVEFPQEPNASDIGQALFETAAMLSERRIEDLVDLPQMSDPYKLAAMKLLSSIFAAAYIASPELVPLTVCKQVNLSVQYGNAFVSGFAYANYGLLLCGVVGDIDLGYQFGQLALTLVSKLNAQEIKAKTLMIVNIFIRPWKEHLRETLKPLMAVYSSGLETGDLQYAAFGLLMYSYLAYFSGKELTVLETEMGVNRNAIHKIKQETALHYIETYWQAILNLLGKSENTCCLKGEVCDEQVRLPLHEQANDRLGIAYIYWNKFLLNYWFENYSQAIENIAIAEKYLDALVGLPLVPIFHFYDSLIRLAMYGDNLESEQQSILERVQANQEKMQKWAHHAPMNHLHKFYLVEAERHRVRGEKIEAIEMYDKAIALAKENEYINEESLAHELAAKFYLSWGKETIAQTYMTNAYYAYQHWGAVAKVKDLEARYPQLITHRRVHGASRREAAFRETWQNIQKSDTNTKELTQTSSTIIAGTDNLDFMTIMKASQTLSGEIVLSKLLAKLMQIVLENAGAQTGYLILEIDGNLLIESKAAVEQKEVIVMQSQPVATSQELPISVINYVARMQENFLCNNTICTGIFATDPYIVTHKPKSLLCTPLLHQGKLAGILYLENNLTTEAFTPDRLEILKLLSSQAAISIENARLYCDLATANTTLEAKVKERTQELQEKNIHYQEQANRLELAFRQLKETQSQLVQSEKMSSLGQLVAGVAHEINNPVNFIYGNLTHASQYLQDLLYLLHLYKKNTPVPSPEIEVMAEVIDLDFIATDLPNLLSSMKIGAERIREIILSLRNFSRLDEAEMKPVDIHQGLDSTLLILQNRLKANSNYPSIQVIKEYGNLPVVECYAGQLNQVFMNLIVNAIDAIEEYEQQQHLQNSQSCQSQIWIRTTAINNEYVAIQIADNGPGMTEDVLQHLFDPFFTTKPVGKGTGLGLSISYQIVAKHGGNMQCISAPGQGAEFTITIPVQRRKL